MRQVPGEEYDRLKDLEAAVRRVVTERADRLCWRDVYTELAGLVGIDFCPALIADPDQFAANCRRFDESLRIGGRYVPVYVEKPMPDSQKENIAAEFLKAIRKRIGDRWYNLNDRDKALIADCAADAAGLELMGLGGANADVIAREKAQIDAQLANIASVGANVAAGTAAEFWKGVGDFATGALSVVIKAAL